MSVQENFKAILALVIGLVASQVAYSGSMGPIIPAPTYYFVTSLALGPAWVDEDKAQTYFLTPEIVKTYKANDSSSVLLDGELFFGMGRQIRDNFSGQLGIALAATSSAKFKGYIWDDADPTFNNYTYRYSVHHAHVALAGKILANNPNFFVTPWVSASVGVGFNEAENFSNSPVIFEAVENPNFADNTTTSFTYTVGAGIQRNLSQNFQIGVGYQFADWGKAQLGRAFGQILNSGLKHNHIHTNGVMVNITYVS